MDGSSHSSQSSRNSYLKCDNLSATTIYLLCKTIKTKIQIKTKRNEREKKQSHLVRDFPLNLRNVMALG